MVRIHFRPRGPTPGGSAPTKSVDVAGDPTLKCPPASPDDVFAPQAVEIHQCPRTQPCSTEGVPQTNAFQMRGESLCQCFAYGSCQPADDGVFLGGDQGTGFLSCLNDEFAIERLECVNLQHASIDTLSCEPFRRLHRPAYHRAGGNKADIVSGTQSQTLANFHPQVLIVDRWRRRPTQSQIYRTIIL